MASPSMRSLLRLAKLARAGIPPASAEANHLFHAATTTEEEGFRQFLLHDMAGCDNPVPLEDVPQCVPGILRKARTLPLQGPPGGLDGRIGAGLGLGLKRGFSPLPDVLRFLYKSQPRGNEKSGRKAFPNPARKPWQVGFDASAEEQGPRGGRQDDPPSGLRTVPDHRRGRLLRQAGEKESDLFLMPAEWRGLFHDALTVKGSLERNTDRCIAIELG